MNIKKIHYILCARIPERSKGLDLRPSTLCFVGSNPTSCKKKHLPKCVNVFDNFIIIKNILDIYQ